MAVTRFIHNPVLHGMHPDPSWIWDGTRGEVALVNSSFELIPGLPIHTTRDFTTWTHVADAVDEDMARRLFLDGVADSGGLYAPTLRRIRGRYVIACTTTRIDRDHAEAAGLGDELARCDTAGGNFIITADTLEGPWQGPFWVSGAEGIDPDIFEDRDGKVWWTQTRPAVDSHWDGQTEVWTAPLDPDTWTIAGERTVIWRGYGLDAVWAEGPHLYRVGDFVYLMTAEGGTSFEHSEMMMRAFAPDGFAAAIEGFAHDCAARGVAIRPAREGERSVLGDYDRLFRACKRNPIVTHRHLGSAEPVQCIGHADLLHHPEAGWMLTCLGVRQTLGGGPGERRSYLGRETFVAPVRWDYEDSQDTLPEPLPGEGQDPGWPTVAPGYGRVPSWLRVDVDEDGRAAAVESVSDSECERLGVTDDVATAGDDVPAIRVQAAGAYRFQPVDDMDWSGAIVPGNALMLRQDTGHYATVEAKASQNGPIVVVHRVDGDEPAWDQFALRAGEAVGLRLHGNRLDVFALDTEALPGQDGSLHVLRDGVPGERSRTLRSYDARFLSTEHAGGFVGCLAGVQAR
ncbi:MULTISPECIES: glycoside hydrolase family 43 protein [Bifidobacterium]|uniref:glycoside hydrolase family 43 protein n=1 Tax=Bifidobacterium TaxID=1678 RepID=UPI001BDC010D|nr:MULTISPECIES: glycoside hydrolase family 43 protein [Bifidobacterium]MBT1162032.1 glycoside hydrolase family 43 protein [Bifidobacterium sp. SO1]MBW3078054.1 glycoside hydrolase family 43 protein [Bifidobacterium simiiventris]